MKPGDRLKAAVSAHDSEPRYWLFLNPQGIVWVAATGRKAAMALAGQVDARFTLLFRTAGEALRVAEQQASARKLAVLNLAALETLASTDPEPASGAATAYAVAKKGAV
jgi:hypothetical protein